MVELAFWIPSRQHLLLLLLLLPHLHQAGLPLRAQLQRPVATPLPPALQPAATVKLVQQPIRQEPALAQRRLALLAVQQDHPTPAVAPGQVRLLRQAVLEQVQPHPLLPAVQRARLQRLVVLLPVPRQHPAVQ
jgi:hypothetical protein